MDKTLFYSSLNEETDNVCCSVQGTVPSWLTGTYSRVGPGLFEIGEERFHHWFDGQAMLYAFRFDKGKVYYSNKLLNSSNLRAHKGAGKIAFPEFGTNNQSWIGSAMKYLYNMIIPPNKDDTEYQNNNVNVAELAGKSVALTETPLPMEFKLNNLDTIGPVRFYDDIPESQLSTAHCQYSDDNRHINFLTKFGKDPVYLIYSVPTKDFELPGNNSDEYDNNDKDNENSKRSRKRKGSEVFPQSAPDVRKSKRTKLNQAQYLHTKANSISRTLIATVPMFPGRSPAYMHSFAMTKNYIILVEFPWMFSIANVMKNRFKVLLGLENTVLDFFQWFPELGTLFTVVDKNDGSIKGRYKGPTTFAYHHVNSYEIESEDKIVLDMICYKKPAYDSLSLDMLKQGSQLPLLQGGSYNRYTICTSEPTVFTNDKLQVNEEVLVNQAIEFPRINYKYHNTKPYRYFYGLSPLGQSQINQKHPDYNGM